MRRFVLPIIVVVGIVAFSSWLMFHTFSYDSTKSSMRISDKVWSDFGSHMPLIRSFTYGQNWPPQNPLFPGEKIRYHFSFYAIAGLLERLGVRVDWAVNVPSVIGFAGLLVMIGVLARRLFSSWSAAVLSVMFFLFNGSLSFVKYFTKHGWTWEAIRAIPTNSAFPTFGPWDGGNIIAIWNLNIFTNQRHLAPALALSLLVIYLINFKKINPIILGACIGLVIFINQAVFAGLALLLAAYFWLSPGQKKYLIKTALCTLPWLLASFLLVNSISSIAFEPGYLAHRPLSAMGILVFWWENLGLHLVLMPLGFILAPRRTKILLLTLVPVFLVPNLWRLSTDMFNNHKLLNLCMVIGVMFSAYFISRLLHKKIFIPIAMVLVGAVTMSGVIDFFALKNDRYLILPDVAASADQHFVLNTIPSTDVVLNSTWFYHSASLAGRPIYNGYTYFTWSHGYDSYAREKILIDIYRAETREQACQLLVERKISFVELNDHPEEYVKPNMALWEGMPETMYYNPSTGVRYYSVAENCSNAQ